MGKHNNSKRYNFRYESERERFYNDVVQERRRLLQTLTDEEQTDLRLVFIYPSDKNKPFAGNRTFRSFTRLKNFLNSTGARHDSGVRFAATKRGESYFGKERILAQLVIWRLKNNRIIGKKVLWEVEIESK